MRRSDGIPAAVALAIILVFGFVPGTMEGFITVTKSYPYLTTFAKFAVLATFGECLGLRVTTGVYTRPGFGILPKAFVWGLLGLAIKLAFTIFSNGAPVVLADLGFQVDAATLKTGPFALKLAMAFCISVTMNIIFSPVLMVAHKVADAHIAATGGTMRGLFSPLSTGRILQEINWNVMWGFVLKKTIPFFWIPAHTCTFLLPSHFQIMAAALLGILLGVVLAVAGAKASQKA